MRLPEELCRICGAMVSEQTNPGISIREIQCPDCSAPKRTRDLVRVLLKEFGAAPGTSLKDNVAMFANKTIFEAQAWGVLHDTLSDLPGYQCSEFMDDVSPGFTNAYGIRCENLETLTFKDRQFDLVITQDVFEHVTNPFKAFQEVYRVLKPSGRHIFTVPVHEGRRSIARRPDMPVFHGDPVREEGSYVVTDFGDNLPELLSSMGIKTRIAWHEIYYRDDEIPFIHSTDEYGRYLENRSLEKMLSYFLYNSLVLVSEK